MLKVIFLSGLGAQNRPDKKDDTFVMVGALAQSLRDFYITWYPSAYHYVCNLPIGVATPTRMLVRGRLSQLRLPEVYVNVDVTQSRSVVSGRARPLPYGQFQKGMSREESIHYHHNKAT